MNFPATGRGLRRLPSPICCFAMSRQAFTLSWPGRVSAAICKATPASSPIGWNGRAPGLNFRSCMRTGSFQLHASQKPPVRNHLRGGSSAKRKTFRDERQVSGMRIATSNDDHWARSRFSHNGIQNSHSFECPFLPRRAHQTVCKNLI